jgi:hypothetical protein
MPAHLRAKPSAAAARRDRLVHRDFRVRPGRARLGHRDRPSPAVRRAPATSRRPAGR